MTYASEVLADSPTVWERLGAATPVTVSAATSSSNYPSDGPANAFDGDPTTPWTTNGTSTGWLRAQLSTAVALTAYTMTSRSAFPTRAAKDWTFEGSNDGSTWTTLDTRTGITSWSSSGETKSFSFTNSTAYLYYRLNVSANNGDTYLDLCELSFPYSLDSSGNNRGLLQPAGTAPSIAGDGPVQSSSMSWSTSAGFVRSAYEMAQPTVGTYEVWVKFAANPSATVTLVSWSPNSGGNGCCSYVQLLTNGKIRLGLYNGSTVTVDSASALTTGAWHHVICSWGAAGNKVRVDKTNTGSGATTSATSPGSSSFRIHGRYDGASNVDQTGAVQLAEAAFYPTQLTNTRTDAHYDAGAPSPDATVTAVPATATAAAVAPVVSAASSVTAVTATATATARPPAVSGTGDATVAAVAATATAAVLPPTISADATIAGAVAAATATAPAPTISAGATVEATPATATADAIIPTVDNGSGSATVFAVPATATADALAPVWTQVLPAETDTSNALDGRDRRGYATATITRPVAAPPNTLTLAPRVSKSRALPTPVMVDGRPT